MSRQHHAGRREDSVPGPERPRWLFLVIGGLIYAGALLGMWIVLAGQPDAQDLAAGSAAAVFAVGVGYLISQRGRMVPSVRAADLRTLMAVPWQVVVETGQVFALAARKASGRPTVPGALSTVPLNAGPDVRGWPAARREAVLTGLLSAAPNTVVVDIDMEAGTALVHQLAGVSPTAGHPPGGHPTGGRPAGGHTPVGRPAAGHPTAGHPPVGDPAAGHPTAGDPADPRPAPPR